MTIHDKPVQGFYAEALCDLRDFKALVERQMTPADAPSAAAIEKNVAIYDVAALTGTLADAPARRALMAEWAHILGSSAGVFVLKQAQPDHAAIDAATAVFEVIIAEEKAAGGSGADHFAAAGSNDRIWNSLQKLCLKSPDVFARYHGSPAIDAASEAWLGPNYQMTAQVNLVRPGGQAQEAHRDYHLGFVTAELSARYPAHVHDLSPLMTLQGGIAHCDAPIESGPTELLPFSQLYRPGYAAYRRKDFRAYFEESYVQVPLEKGDAIFFNPALFHAAGENRSTDVQRLVNLLQVSSAFGRSLENVDRLAMCKALYEPLAALRSSGALSDGALSAAIAASAEGYAFPTNLDTDPPVGGLAPESQAALIHRALASGMAADEVFALLDAQEQKKRA
ncbi:MAG: phytanoyl-CoA dioxygenase family protein [Pseudomonadota bacterium]